MSTFVPQGFASPSVRRFDDPVTSEQVRSKAIGFVPDDFTLLRGNAVVPALWAQAETEASAEGVYYVSRPSVLDINPEAAVRFVPTDDTWDDVAFVWNPLISKMSSRYQFDGNVLSSPLLIDTRYQIGKELFVGQALSFDADKVLTSDFNDGFDDAYSFTLAMAVDLRGNDFDMMTFDDGSYIRIDRQGVSARVGVSRPMTIRMPRAPQSLSPLFIALEVTPPSAMLSASWGPTTTYRASSAIPNRTTSFTFTMSGDFDLYGLDIWGDDRPTLTEVMAAYASVFGSNQ